MNFQKRPLAEMMRPETFDDMVGQAHLFGKNGVIRNTRVRCELAVSHNII